MQDARKRMGFFSCCHAKVNISASKSKKEENLGQKDSRHLSPGSLLDLQAVARGKKRELYFQ